MTENRDVIAVLAGFSLVFYEEDGMAELGTELTETNPEDLRELFSEEEYIIIRAAINAVRRLSGRVQREIHNEIRAVRQA